MAETEKKFLDQAGLKYAFQLLKDDVEAKYLRKSDYNADQGDVSSVVDGKINDAKEELSQAIADAQTAVEGKIAEAKTDVEGQIADAKSELEDAVADAADAADKALADTKSELEDAIAEAKSEAADALSEAKTELEGKIDDVVAELGDVDMKYVVVEELPAEPAKMTIYLMKPEQGDDPNIYQEFIFAEGAWEMIGDTKIALADYAKTADLEAAKEELENAVEDVQTALDEFAQDVEVTYVKEENITERVTEIINTEEVKEIITKNVFSITNAEIAAAFAGTPVGVTKANGTIDTPATISAALASAEAGDVIVIVDDVEIPEGTEIPEGVTIYANGKVIVC